MTQTLYTFGYLSTKAERIFKELIAVRTPIIDVRYKPVSKHWQYMQSAIRQRDGIIYFYIKELGNEWYKEALAGKFQEPHIKLHAPEEGLAKLQAVLEEYGRAAIFCACSSKKTCHRIEVAKLAQERIAGLEVIHL
jgi:hypothetical protein